MSVDVEPSKSKDDRRRPTPTIDLTESQPALAEKKKYVQCVGFGAIKSLKSKSNPKNLRIWIGFANVGKGSDLIRI